jgi:hypothetical protein
MPVPVRLSALILVFDFVTPGNCARSDMGSLWRLLGRRRLCTCLSLIAQREIRTSMAIKRPMRTDRLLIERRMLESAAAILSSHLSCLTRLGKPLHFKLPPLLVLFIQTGLRFDVDLLFLQLIS